MAHVLQPARQLGRIDSTLRTGNEGMANELSVEKRPAWCFKIEKG